MTSLYLVNQSIPRITSTPLESRIIRLAGNSTPLILSFNLRHAYLDSILPPGVSTNIVNFINDVGKLYFVTKLDDMKECVAPQSNRTIIGLELMVNIPSTISGAI